MSDMTDVATSLELVAQVMEVHYRENPNCKVGCDHLQDVRNSAKEEFDRISPENPVAKASWWLLVNSAIGWR